MTTRDIFILALRVLAFWFFLRAISGLTHALSGTYQFFQMFDEVATVTPGVNLVGYVVIAWATPVIQCLAACALWLYSTDIAAIFYGRAHPNEEAPPAITVTERGMYRIAAKVLGICALFTAVYPVSKTIAYYTVPIASDTFDTNRRTELIAAALYLVFGIVLICGAGRIGGWLAKLRYNPDTANPAKYHSPTREASEVPGSEQE